MWALALGFSIVGTRRNAPELRNPKPTRHARRIQGLLCASDVGQPACPGLRLDHATGAGTGTGTEADPKNKVITLPKVDGEWLVLSREDANLLRRPEASGFVDDRRINLE